MAISDKVLLALALRNKGGGGSSTGDMKTAVYDKDVNGIVDNAQAVNGHTVGTDVPDDAVFTDTVYDDTEIKEEINKKAEASVDGNNLIIS